MSPAPGGARAGAVADEFTEMTAAWTIGFGVGAIAANEIKAWREAPANAANAKLAAAFLQEIAGMRKAAEEQAPALREIRDALSGGSKAAKRHAGQAGRGRGVELHRGCRSQAVLAALPPCRSACDFHSFVLTSGQLWCGQMQARVTDQGAGG